jgi:cobalt/nickel transport system permease protein
MTLNLRPVPVPDSPVARWDARWKLTALLAAAAGIVMLRSPATALLAMMGAGALARLARIPRREIVARLGLVAWAVLPVLLIVPLTLDRGTAIALGVGFRAEAMGLLALVLVRSAPPARSLAAARALGVPGALIQIAQLAHRYAFLLAAEARRMRVALLTRGFRLRTTSHTYRTLGYAVGGLLVRGGDRAERVAAAMRCRGFDGSVPKGQSFRMTWADVCAALAVAAVTVTLVFLDRFEWM